MTAIHAAPADGSQTAARGGASLGRGGEIYTLDAGDNTVTLDTPDGSRSFNANGGGTHGG